jgi:RimJ/RimL family protein N-acetyltransferase
VDPFELDDTPERQTARLLLRSIGSQDRDAFFDIFSDPETVQYWVGAPITAMSEAAALVERDLGLTASRTCINWGIVLPESNRLIGKFTLFAYSRQNRRAEVGYILDRRYWGKGLMSEVMTEALDYAFGSLALHRLEADTDPANAASLALLEKFGFKREGFFRERWLVAGKWLDSAMLGLLAEDYVAPTPGPSLRG